MKIIATTKDAYRLMHEGALALAEVERNGIRVDVEYCKKQEKILERRINHLENGLEEDGTVKIWRKEYGQKFNINSNPQLADILFNHLKLPCSKKTIKGQAAVDEGVLSSMDLPMVKTLLEIKKFKKVKSTYLGGVMREAHDGIIHPFFNLHTVRTFRSSSDKPNFQNIPIRDPEIGKIIRRAFLPHPGHRFGGVDYGGIEIKISACYHKDPVMLKYIHDPSSDLHRDTAMECFLLKEEEVIKPVRYCGKNMFVFPQFYGDYYKNCAMNLWKAIDSMGLKKVDGTPLKEHLRDKGIKSYQSFEKHIQDVEYRFWNEKFKVYAQWKEDWFAAYERRGYFDTLTGFRCGGVMGKNDVINYPVQGSAFHCLLWSLIQLVKWFKEEGFRSKIVGQIHDEITQSLHLEEFDHILSHEQKIMCEDIREAWPWIITPLTVEAEFGGVDESWYEKKPVEIGGEASYVLTS